MLPKIGPTSGAINLGCHVEGPFVNKKRVGAHAVENLRTFENVSVSSTGSLFFRPYLIALK